MTDNDFAEIKQVVEQAYIRGIHEEQNRILIDTGLHPTFEMLVLGKNEVMRVSINKWLTRI